MISFSWVILKYSENVKIMISGYIWNIQMRL